MISVSRPIQKVTDIQQPKTYPHPPVPAAGLVLAFPCLLRPGGILKTRELAEYCGLLFQRRNQQPESLQHIAFL